MKDKLKSGSYIFFASVALIYASAVSFVREETEGIISFKAGFYNERLIETGFVVFIAVLVLMTVLSKFRPIDKGAKKISVFMGIFIAFCIVMGRSYKELQTWDYVFGSVSVFIASAISFAGWFIFIYHGVNTLIYFIREYDKTSLYAPFEAAEKRFFGRFAAFKIFIILMIGCLPYIIINYPGIVHADSMVMLGQYTSGNFTNHHPILQTLFWGAVVSAGEKIFGSQSAGIFIYSFFQTVYGCAIFAVIIDYIRKKGCPALIWMGAVVFMTIFPMFPRHITTICKDHNFSLFIVLMLFIMMKLFDIRNEKIIGGGYLLKFIIIVTGWFFTLLLVMFSRKSGIHTLIITVPFLLIYLRRSKAVFAAVIIATLGALGVFEVTEYTVSNVYNIENHDTRETLSLLFQQTARCVKFHGDELTEEERTAISGVLDLENMADAYNPELCDPVKEGFKLDAEKGAMAEYLGIWLKMLFKYPDCYFQAAFNAVNGYFYPSDIGYYTDFYFNSYKDIKFNELYQSFRERDMRSRNLPMAGMTSCIAFYVWLVIFETLYFITYEKDKKYLIYTLPALATILICILSPANGTVRYALPIIYSSVILICLCFDKNIIPSEIEAG